MFREAMGYPTRQPNGGRVVFAGGALLAVVFVAVAMTQLGWPYGLVAAVGLLPWLLVRGYYVRVIRTTIGRDAPLPPSFSSWRALLADGATAVGISVAYMLPAAIILAPLAAVQLLGNDLSAPISALPTPVVDGVLSGVGFLAVFALMYLLGALYVLPVAVARFAYTDRVSAAFDIRTVVGGALTEDYATAWFVSVTLQFFVLPVAYLLRIILVGFLLQFVVAVAVRYCYGQGVGDAMGWDPVDPDGGPVPWDELTPAVTRVTDAGAKRTTARRDTARAGRWPDTEPAVVRIKAPASDGGGEDDGNGDTDGGQEAEGDWVPASSVTIRRNDG